jgi:hypothetical protein
MGQGFVIGQHRRYGISWAENIVLQDKINWDDNKYINFALGLPAEHQTWNLIKKWGDKIYRMYWKNVASNCISPYEDSTEYAIKELREAGRHYAALNLVSFSIRSSNEKKDRTTLPKELIVELLEETPNHNPKEEKDVAYISLSYDIPELLDVLEAKGVEKSKLIQLEWIWMPALEYSKRGLKSLQEALSEDPKLFIDILKLVYRGKNEKPQDWSEQEKARAEQASRLLRQWKTVPGLLGEHIEEEKDNGDISFSEGQVDSGKLSAWVNEARKLANECERVEICDIQIGNILAYSPCDSKGHWPCEAVCDLIEKLASSELEHGIEVGVYNKRGASFRAKGGTQERALAAKFRQYAQEDCSKWPRTAVMLNRIGESYERDARREDEWDAFKEFE